MLKTFGFLKLHQEGFLGPEKREDVTVELIVLQIAAGVSVKLKCQTKILSNPQSHQKI